MKKILVVIAGILLSLSIYFAYRTIPEVQNTLRPVLPSPDVSTIPDEPVTENKTINQAGSIITSQFDRTYSTDDIASFVEGLYSAYEIRNPRYPVDLYRVAFNTTDENGQLLSVRGQMYIPDTETGDQLPVYVFGAGTTGIEDHCAPSKEIVSVNNWGDYNAHMLSYATQGYIVFFPDYEGFNDLARVHHYFHARLEANVMLDAARATYDFYNKNPDVEPKPRKAVFFAGYSQGGHAAFAARDYANEYAPEVPIKGVIGYAPAPNIRTLLLENPNLAPYLVVAYNDLYPEVVTPERILNNRFLADLQDKTTEYCISEASTLFSKKMEDVYRPEFIEALNNEFAGAYQDMGEIFEKNGAGYREGDIPILYLQGGADPITSEKSANLFLEESCANNNRITYQLYPGVHHYQTRQVSYIDTFEWMEAVLADGDIENYCASAT